LLVCCADCRCCHSVAVSGYGWPDDVRLSDIEERFTCRVCGKRGADVRPDFNWNQQPGSMTGRTMYTELGRVLINRGDAV
jgi:hypothetical protein